MQTIQVVELKPDHKNNHTIKLQKLLNDYDNSSPKINPKNIRSLKQIEESDKAYYRKYKEVEEEEDIIKQIHKKWQKDKRWLKYNAGYCVWCKKLPCEGIFWTPNKAFFKTQDKILSKTSERQPLGIITTKKRVNKRKRHIKPIYYKMFEYSHKKAYKTSTLRLFNIEKMINAKGYYFSNMNSIKEKMRYLNDQEIVEDVINEIHSEINDHDMVLINDQKLFNQHINYMQKRYVLYN